MGKRSLYPPPVADKAATMARFDALPAVVRRAIASAAFQFHPQAVERLMRRGISADRCAALLTEIDRRRSARAGGSQ